MVDPALAELLRTSSDNDAEEVEAIIRLDHPQVEMAGVRIVSRFGPIVTCRLRRDAILATRQHEDVRSVKASRILSPEDEPEDMSATLNLPLTPVVSDVRRPFGLPLTGAGVVIGLVDWGCDFAAPSFRHPDGSTRLIALWDQRGLPLPDAPNAYGYGTFYGRRQINGALRHADPYSALGYHPADADPGRVGTHGTHVMDIAAGNGRGGGPVGVAPGADLCFVHLADKNTGGLANLGDSVRILEAIDFIARTAGCRPWVVNLSVGRHGGCHKGRTLVEMAYDIALRAAPGRCIVHSGGNYFDKRIHASGRLQAGQTRTLSLSVDEADITPNELEVWYSGGDAFAVRTTSPTGAPSPWVRLDEQADVIEHGRVVGRIYNRALDPNNGDNHIDMFLYPDAPPGSWTVTLKAETVSDGVFHAWIEKDEACPSCQTHFSAFDAESSCTTGTLANGRMPLVVGAYDAHSPSRDAAPFSSAGPTRDGRPKPDMVAPGVGVLAARSAPHGWHTNANRLVRKNGTSMAAPHVTGTVALCLQGARRPLWCHEIRELILRNTEPVAAHVQHPLRYGRGYLDVAKVVAAVLARPPRVTTSSASRPMGAQKPASRPKERQMIPNIGRHFDRLEHIIQGSPSRAASEREVLAEILRSHGAPFAAQTLDPDALYRAVAFRHTGPLAALIDAHFTVLARPGEVPVAAPQAGDVLMRVGLPGLGHVAVLAEATLWPAAQLAHAPFSTESQRRGFYALVIEPGACPHTRADLFARCVLDAAGRMLSRQVLLRLKAPVGEEIGPAEAQTEFDSSVARFVKESPFEKASIQTRATDPVRLRQDAKCSCWPPHGESWNESEDGEELDAREVEVSDEYEDEFSSDDRDTQAEVDFDSEDNGELDEDETGVSEECEERFSHVYGDTEEDLSFEAFTECPLADDVEFGEQVIPQQPTPPPAPARPDSSVANRFVAAHHTRYCTPGQAGSATCQTLTAPRPIRRVVIHALAVPSTAQRSGVEAVVAGWQNAGRQASAHYLVDRDGTITQMVREANVAFHTPGNNRDSIGIEHADVCNDPAPLTTQLYERSAALVRDLATRHGFAINNNTVAGHSQVNPNHGDPGPYWDWEYFFLLLAWDGIAVDSRPIRLVTTAAKRPAAPTGWQVQRRRAIANDHCANQRDPWGATYWRTQPSATGTAAELSLVVNEACTYKVSLWWPDVAGANPAVPVDIEVACLTSPCSGTSTQSVTVNQRPNTGRWNDVAVVSVTQTPAELKIRWRRNSAQPGWILVDSVRLLKIASCPGPSLQTASSDEDANAPFSPVYFAAENSSLSTILDASTRANWDIEKWVETEEELMEALAEEEKAVLGDFDGEDLEDVVRTQPDGAVRSPNVDVFAKPDTSLTKQASLPHSTPVPRIVTKKQVGATWWYEIEYDLGTQTTRGWAIAEGIAELAWPGKFTFLSPGESDAFEELRNAVKGKSVEEKVARSINFLNVFLLPNDKATLGNFVHGAFYQALVAAKGNFKEACLILTASIRAFKPDGGGARFRWVQQVDQKSKSFNYGEYADKLWHFFWNAYKRLDGTSAWTLDKLGIAYELKTRSSPIWSLITLKDLSRDAKEDIVFNRGGIAFAEWLNKNHPEVTKAQAAAIRDNFLAVGKQSADFNQLSEDAKAKFIQQLMEKQSVQDELKKRTYTEFAGAAEGIVDNVVKWIKQMK